MIGRFRRVQLGGKDAAAGVYFAGWRCSLAARRAGARSWSGQSGALEREQGWTEHFDVVREAAAAFDRAEVEPADRRHCALLGMRSAQPCSSHTADKRDELAASSGSREQRQALQRGLSVVGGPADLLSRANPLRSRQSCAVSGMVAIY